VNRRTLLFAVAVLAQLVALYAPRAPSEGGVPHLDKVVHLLLFAAVVCTGLRAGAPRWVVLMLSVVQAPVSELLQWAVLPHRDGDLRDLLADLIGCALGWWLARRAMMVR
jgi:VanZ family protein